MDMEPQQESDRERCAICHIHPLENRNNDNKVPLLESSGEPPDQLMWSGQEHELEETPNRPEMDFEEVQRYKTSLQL